MTEEQEILKKLLVDEKDLIKDMPSIVEKVREVFVIENRTGRVIFINIEALSDSQRISALLLGRYFAQKLALIDFYPIGVAEMANQLGRPKTALSGPLKDLINILKKWRKKGVDSLRGGNFNRDLIRTGFIIEVGKIGNETVYELTKDGKVEADKIIKGLQDKKEEK